MIAARAVSQRIVPYVVTLDTGGCIDVHLLVDGDAARTVAAGGEQRSQADAEEEHPRRLIGVELLVHIHTLVVFRFLRRKGRMWTHGRV